MKKSYNFQNAYRRLCNICGVLTQTQVAGVMGCSQASVAGFIKREKMPDSWLMKLTLKYNINPRWLLWGDEHKMFLSPTDKDPGNGENGNSVSGSGREG